MGTESFEGVYCLCKMTGWLGKEVQSVSSAEQIRPDQR
jgi:hypothetical protein